MSTAWQRLREKLINFYPPFLGAGIHADSLDEHTINVRMKLTPWNRNIVGTHFGGSLYAMCDPWFMLILMRLLGEAYVVWDKSARIRFLRPGRGNVSARFHIPQERVDQIRIEAERREKTEPAFSVEITDEDGQIVAQVEKLLYVRRKSSQGSNHA